MEILKVKYWEKLKDRPEQENGFCWFLEAGDGDILTGDTGPIDLLWDSVKCCGIHDDMEEDGE